jgi:hypothetical protein
MCRAYTLLSTAGAACDQAALRVCSPVANLSCVSGACVSNGTAAAGSACATGDLVEVFSCNAGLYCDRMTRRCVARQAAGAACDSDRACTSGECAGGRCLDRMCNTTP